MKYILSLSILLFTFLAKAQDSKVGAQFKFEHEMFDFGTVKAGTQVKHEYKFTNVGTIPLVIKDASAGCSCTKAEWPKQPILPGKQGIITVTFDSKDKSGTQYKNIYIQSNAISSKPRTEIILKGSVDDGKKKAN